MFTNASNFVQGVDKVFLIILGISLFFLVTLTGAMIYFIVKYNRKKNVPAVQVKDNMWLELSWIIVPMILVIYMFIIGWAGFIPMRQAPKDAMQVKAIAQMWKWTFEYPGYKQSDTLVLPIHKAVKIDLISKDVLHGFSIPAFRIKEDVVPVKDNYSWFIPGELGSYDLFCTVYCGLSHSYMTAIVKIMPQDEFDKWLAILPVKKEDNRLGFKLIEKNGCIACHSIDGSKVVGPTLKGIYGAKRTVTTAGIKREVTVDDAYLKTAVYDPNIDVVEGYPPGLMKSYKGLITEEEITQINEYLKELK